jgi:hypothetical protein
MGFEAFELSSAAKRHANLDRNISPNSAVVADRPEDEASAAERRSGIFEAWDMLAGRAAPELGGEEALLDVLGVNYYANNQLLLDGPPLAPDDPRRRSFSSHLIELGERYGRPLVVTETAGAGDQRARGCATSRKSAPGPSSRERGWKGSRSILSWISQIGKPGSRWPWDPGARPMRRAIVRCTSRSWTSCAASSACWNRTPSFPPRPNGLVNGE